MADRLPPLSVGDEGFSLGREVRIKCVSPLGDLRVADVETGHETEISADQFTRGSRTEIPLVSSKPAKDRVQASDAHSAAKTARKNMPAGDGHWDDHVALSSDWDSEESQELETVSAADMAVAYERRDALTPLLGIERRTRKDVDEVAKKLGCSAAQVYRYLKSYEASNDIGALLPRKGGRPKGTSNLSGPVEMILRDAIRSFMHAARLPVPDIIDRVELSCHKNNLTPPSHNTIRKRIQNIPKDEKLKARGLADLAEKRYGRSRKIGDFATSAREVIMIDHTLADIMLVDSVTRQPVGRPWVSMGIDVATRLPDGIYVSYKRPNSVSVGALITRILGRKNKHLAALGIDGVYDFDGPIATIHCDNAGEFDNSTVRSALARHGIDMQFRPVGKPNYGSYIECLMGELARLAARFPGKTLSEVRKRRGLDPESEAALTIEEFESMVTEYFYFIYPNRHHTGIGTTPMLYLDLCRQGAGIGKAVYTPKTTFDEARIEQIRIETMPFEMLTAQHYGLQCDHFRYYSRFLDKFIKEDRKVKKKYLVRIDPFDASHVFFLDEANERYVRIPLASGNSAPFSREEAKAVRAALKQAGHDHTDERLFFQKRESIRQRAIDAQDKTKAKADRKFLEKVRESQMQSDEIKRLFRQDGTWDIPTKDGELRSPPSLALPAPSADQQTSADAVNASPAAAQCPAEDVAGANTSAPRDMKPVNAQPSHDLEDLAARRRARAHRRLGGD